MEAVAAALSVEYEKVKENLKGVDENINKLYGRDPNENRLQRRISRPGGNVGAQGGFGGSPAGRLFGEARRIINNPNREPIGGPLGMDRGRGPTRRVSLGDGPRIGNIQSRLGPKRRRPDSDDEEVTPRKVVPSAVVAPTIEPPKREDSVAMKTDKKGMARNRRMFGALLGTLQSFQKDSKKEEDKEKRRAEVEKKLEQKQKEEQYQLRRDKAALWNERREKQRELRQLEAKMKLVKSFEDWEAVVKDQANFIKTTKGKYHIFYMPKVLLPANKRAWEDTEDYIEDMIEDRKKKLQEEIDRIMSAPVRRRPSRSRERRSRSKEGEKSAESDSGSDQADDSDLEEGEVVSRRPHPMQVGETEALLPVKVEKEDAMVVKQEAVDVKEETEDNARAYEVRHERGDEVDLPSGDELETSFNSAHSDRSTGRQSRRSDRGPSAAGEGEARQRRRDDSDSSRSRSRSRERRPPRPKPGKKSAQSSSSSSGSDSRSGSSGSSSGSDSEYESKSKSGTPKSHTG